MPVRSSKAIGLDPAEIIGFVRDYSKDPANYELMLTELEGRKADAFAARDQADALMLEAEAKTAGVSVREKDVTARELAVALREQANAQLEADLVRREETLQTALTNLDTREQALADALAELSAERDRLQEAARSIVGLGV